MDGLIDKIWAVVPKTSALSSALDAFLLPRSILVEFTRFSARSITLVVEFVGADKEILATGTVHLGAIPTLGSPNEWHPRTLPANKEWLAASTTNSGDPTWILGSMGSGSMEHRGALFFPNWLRLERDFPQLIYPQALQLQFALLVASKSLAATHEVQLRLESREQTIKFIYCPRLVGKKPNLGTFGAPMTAVTLKARDKKD